MVSNVTLSMRNLGMFYLCECGRDYTADRATIYHDKVSFVPKLGL